MKRLSSWLSGMRLATFFVAGLLLLGGCATMRRPPAIPADVNSAERVLAALEANYGRLDRFRGEGRLSVSAPGRSFSLDTRVFIDRPDTLYVRLEALFGLDVGWLFADRIGYLFYIPMQNAYGRGPVDSLSLNGFIDVMPDYDQFLATLTGIELARHLTTPRLSREGKLLVLTGHGALGMQTFWIDPERGVITRSEVVDSTGVVVLRQQFDRFSRVNGVQLPFTIKVLRPLEQQGMTLFYERVSVNKKFSAKEIKLKIPASARKMNFKE